MPFIKLFNISSLEPHAKRSKPIPIMVLLLIGFSALHARAEVVFLQDFSKYPSGTFSPYLNVNNPDNGQWNSQSGGMDASLSGGVLNVKQSAAGAIVRTTDFAPAATALIFRFDISVTSSANQSSSARFQIGSGFAAGSAAESSTVHSEFGIALGTGNSFAFRELQGGTALTYLNGRQSILWIINNTGAPFDYQAPNGTMQTVGSDKWDLWASASGFHRSLFDEAKCAYGDKPLQDMKLWFNSGSGTISLDNFLLENQIAAVPEPAATGVLAAAFLGLIILAGRFRRHGIRSRR